MSSDLILKQRTQNTGNATSYLSLIAPDLRKKDPCATLDQIAVLASKQTGYKVSRQRIYSILLRVNCQTSNVLGHRIERQRDRNGRYLSAASN